MYSPRFLLLMVAALCVVDAALMQNFNLARQADAAASATGNDSKGSATGSATTPASSPPSLTPTPSSTAPPSSSSTAAPTSTPTPSSTPAPTSTPSSSSTQAPSSSTPVPTSQQPTSQTPQPTEQPTSEQQEPTSKSTFTSVVTSTSTPAASSTAKSTPTPGLNSDKDGATSGMPAKTRNTVIGVVVGIGGAILLGALGMVAYRIWGRKKHSEEADGLMSYDLSTNGYEKHQQQNSISSNNQRTPFQSTLENYHQPGHVNPSSNF